MSAAKTKQASRDSAVDAGLSLDQLSAAFAEMLNSGEDPYEQPSDQSADSDEAVAHAPTIDTVSAADKSCELSPLSIVEAILFVGSPGNEEISSDKIASLMRGVRPAEIDAHIRTLNEQYASTNCPYRIESQGSGYRLVLQPTYHRVRDRFYGKARQAKLSQAAIEVLALVAYNQPIGKEEIDRLRGTASSSILGQLVRRELLSFERDPQNKKLGHYRTTPRFLALFGIDSLEDLPQSDDTAPAS